MLDKYDRPMSVAHLILTRDSSSLLIDPSLLSMYLGRREIGLQGKDPDWSAVLAAQLLNEFRR